MSGIPKKLREVWTLKHDEHISARDSTAIDPLLKLDYFYQTHLLPQPWWGNIEDPEVIFLALNPSYDPVIDDEDESHIESSLKENLTSKTINWFEHKEIKTRNEQTRKTSNFEWWEKTLKGLYNAGIPNDEEKIYNKVGFFQLCGYHSRNYNEMTKICFKEGYDILPTQKAVVEYVKYLISSDKSPYVVVIWGEKKWEEAGVEFNPQKLVVLNKVFHYNHRFDKAPEIYQPITNIIYSIIKK
jgi:hypothetical protein